MLDVLKLTIQNNFPNEFLMKYSLSLLFLNDLIEKLFFLIEISYFYCKKEIYQIICYFWQKM